MNITNCYYTCNDYYYFNKYNEFQCEQTCPEEYNKSIIPLKKCVSECKQDDDYKYEFNYNCYKKCPNKTYLIENNEDYLCLNQTPIGYYFDSENEIYKKCYKSCKECNKGGNEINHNCITCKTDYTFYPYLRNVSNCYKNCEFYHYFNESNHYHCTSNLECPINYNKKIIEKNKCVTDCKEDDIYIYNYENICYKECPNKTFTNDSNLICYDYQDTETFVLEELSSIPTSNETRDERDVEIENFRGNIFDFNVTEKQEDIVTIKENVQYQMTTSDNQKNNTNKNKSTIDLGDCEAILKDVYGIEPSLPLLIFKIDYFSKDTLIPIIGYEIYHPINKSKLNLAYCEDILIKLNIPVNIDENSLFKHDPNSQFYHDNCFSYTTENGTDIILKDRKQEFINNNLSPRENNCNYTGHNEENKQSSCNCNIKNKMELISEIIDNPNKLSNSFDSEESGSNAGVSNIISIKCTNILFTKEGLKNNISSYILLIFILHFLLSIILFIKCGYPLLMNDINEILNEKKKCDKKKINNKSLLICQKKNIKKEGSTKFWKKKVNFASKKYNKKFNNNNMKFSKIRETQNASYKIRNLNKIFKSINIISNKIKNKKTNINSSKQYLNNKAKESYNDFELNSLDYKNAISFDKRTFCLYYFFLVKIKNPIIFSFCPLKDYNSRIIKLCIFSLSFSIYYAVNFFFFDDKIMHQIYEVGGKYDIIYFLPKITISFVASYYATSLIKFIFLSERNIFEIRKQDKSSLAYSIAEKEKKNLIIKYNLFFALGLIFLVFFWMLLSSFGAVYPNTQMFIFKNSLVSFSMSLIYPEIISIFPCIFRIYSLHSSNKEYLYKISNFLQIL